MNRKIQVLDQHCINQIAAGEVIERPLSVVKELVENSLDAEAHNIEIVIEGSGTALIMIKDNGSGISAEDLPYAVVPHATSKINRIEDLDCLYSLGFRGEALASIASVSNLTLVSRREGQSLGHRIISEGGKISPVEETGSPLGTTVTVKNLFYNTPARYKFLKSPSTEFGLISDIVGKLAMARPDVSFTLKHPQNIVLTTPGNNNLLEAVASVLGTDIAKRLLSVSFSTDYCSIRGFISPPDIVRSSRLSQIFIVNGRVIKSKILTQGVSEGYHTFVPNKTYPVVVLTIEVHPSEFDVNVHPAKTEIKFKQEKYLKESIIKALQQTLLERNSFKRLTFTQDNDQKKEQIDVLKQEQTLYPKKLKCNEQKSARETAANYNTGPISSNKASSAEPHSEGDYDNEKAQQPHFKEIKLSENNQDKETDQVISAYPNLNNAEYDKLSNNTFEFFKTLRPLAQLFNTYILSTDENSLFIIDQHAAHERIQYENLLTTLQTTAKSTQLLLLPVTVNVTLQEEQVLLEYLETLNTMGFIIEMFGERTYLLRGIPYIHGLETPEKYFLRFIDDVLVNSQSPTMEELIEEWIFMISCRESIKGEQRLSMQQMQELIINLGQTNNPYTCPHGRPIVVELTKNDLAKRFNRH